MKLKYLLFFLIPTILLASDGGSGETDIVSRTINFIIFVSIMYYLLADHAKNFYKNRIANIADSLDSIQVKVKESVMAKQSAQAKVEEAKINASVLLETSKKEAKLIAIKIENNTNRELQILEKSFQEKTDIEKRRMARDVATKVLEEVFDKDSISIDKAELVKIIMKKVA
ncbi:MAG: F0F1 ATP synthase subunit B [Sulfurospirillum sp.]|nr:F0F1 ATP synthase subunit B [Sulfurospirillum sp.]MBL0703862.1 F0F1 ATP synthase subunit B [Sulfurospirillum sp.]